MMNFRRTQAGRKVQISGSLNLMEINMKRFILVGRTKNSDIK